jgi:DNA (cytosine-5)-methyltransferase 1
LLARDYKDPKCVEIEPIRIGGLYDNEKGKHQAGAIWDKETIAPTVDTMQGGNRQPLITEEPLAYDEQNGHIRQDGTVGTLTTDGSSPKHNNSVVEFIKSNNQNAKHQQDLLQHQDDVSRCIPAGTQGSTPHLTKTVVSDFPLRIRKLTPKECWRLMGFDDADFEKAAQFNSNSQLYKQAGNSIVVDVLYYIFGMML